MGESATPYGGPTVIWWFPDRASYPAQPATQWCQPRRFFAWIPFFKLFSTSILLFVMKTSQRFATSPHLARARKFQNIWLLVELVFIRLTLMVNIWGSMLPRCFCVFTQRFQNFFIKSLFFEETHYNFKKNSLSTVFQMTSWIFIVFH